VAVPFHYGHDGHYGVVVFFATVLAPIERSVG